MARARAAVPAGQITLERDFPNRVDRARRFIDRAEAWVESGVQSDEAVPALEKWFADAWRASIAEEAPHFGADEMKLLELDVELNAQGLAFAAQAMRAQNLKSPRDGAVTSAPR